MSNTIQPTNAHTYAMQEIPLAKAHAIKITEEAKVYKRRRSELSSAEVKQFEKRLQAYAVSPAIFCRWMYFRVLSDSLPTVRKYIIATEPSREVITFNMEETIQTDLFDLSPALSTHKEIQK